MKEVFIMNYFSIQKVDGDPQIAQVAQLAETIWKEHFTPIIGAAQVQYMLEKFQSVCELKQQLQEGYEYYGIFLHEQLCGYCGIHPENNRLFLSKLYLKKEARGQHLATKTFLFLKSLCKERGLRSIWLTCNRNNSGSLAVYRHLGFQTVKEEKTDIGNGYFMDDYIMECSV